MGHEEGGDAEEKEAVESLTIRQLENVQAYLEQINTETFLGRKSKSENDSNSIPVEKGQEMIREFLSGEHALDSNTKIKLYKRVKDVFIEKMEDAVEFLDTDLQELELAKPHTEAVGPKMEFDAQVELLSQGIAKLKELNFWDLTELKHLEERLEKLEEKA